jgi:hypothetical protein
MRAAKAAIRDFGAGRNLMRLSNTPVAVGCLAWQVGPQKCYLHALKLDLEGNQAQDLPAWERREQLALRHGDV